MKRLHTLVALSVALVLAACGGDDGGGGTPSTPPVTLSEVPDSALASSQAFSQFVGSLPASDTADGLKLKEAAAPVSDSDEPMLVS
jgi:hypothetical protein